jgi:hypothetical protein
MVLLGFGHQLASASKKLVSARRVVRANDCFPGPVCQIANVFYVNLSYCRWVRFAWDAKERPLPKLGAVAKASQGSSRWQPAGFEPGTGCTNTCRSEPNVGPVAIGRVLAAHKARPGVGKPTKPGSESARRARPEPGRLPPAPRRAQEAVLPHVISGPGVREPSPPDARGGCRRPRSC